MLEIYDELGLLNREGRTNESVLVTHLLGRPIVLIRLGPPCKALISWVVTFRTTLGGLGTPWYWGTIVVPNFRAGHLASHVLPLKLYNSLINVRIDLNKMA